MSDRLEIAKVRGRIINLESKTALIDNSGRNVTFDSVTSLIGIYTTLTSSLFSGSFLTASNISSNIIYANTGSIYDLSCSYLTSSNGQINFLSSSNIYAINFSGSYGNYSGHISSSLLLANQLSSSYSLINNLSATYLFGDVLNYTEITSSYISSSFITSSNNLLDTINNIYLSSSYISSSYITSSYLNSTFISATYVTSSDISGSKIYNTVLSSSNITSSYLISNYITGTYLSGNVLYINEISSTDITGSNAAINTVSCSNLITLDNVDGSTTLASINGSGKIIRTPSDARLKKDIVSFNDGLNKTLSLNPVSFYWIDKNMYGNQKQLGLIAQEVVNHVPESVNINKDGFYNLDYGKIIPVMISAIKELNEKNNYLECKIQNLIQYISGSVK